LFLDKFHLGAASLRFAGEQFVDTRIDHANRIGVDIDPLAGLVRTLAHGDHFALQVGQAFEILFAGLVDQAHRTADVFVSVGKVAGAFVQFGDQAGQAGDVVFARFEGLFVLIQNVERFAQLETAIC
jgi:hypothetical protein